MRRRTAQPAGAPVSVDFHVPYGFYGGADAKLGESPRYWCRNLAICSFDRNFLNTLSQIIGANINAWPWRNETRSGTKSTALRASTVEGTPVQS